MMTRVIHPSGPLHATFRVPGSKSITNRALVCAALADGVSTLRNASDSDDTALMVNALNQLGVLVQRDGERMTVHGTGGVLHAPRFPIPVGNAGTTLRFLLSVAAIARGTVVLQGNDRMAERPNEDLLHALNSLGVGIRQMPGQAVFEIAGGTLRGGVAHVKGEKSSQFLSSLLLAVPYAEQPVEIALEGRLASESYVAMTLEVMRSFGVDVSGSVTQGLSIPAGLRYRPSDFMVEADASGASYPMAAVAIAGGEVLVPGFRLRSLQGDAGFAAVLRLMGCEIVEKEEGVLARRTAPLRGVSIDMNSMPDVVPTLAAVALFAEGPTSIRNVAHLRFKESDRLGALEEELSNLGADITCTDDGLDIRPTQLHGALLDTHDDHRLAMSFALVGLAVPGVTIGNPECVRKSFPRFWTEFDKATADS